MTSSQGQPEPAPSGDDSTPALTDRLFLALFPPAPAVAGITRLGAQLREQLGITDAVVAPDRLHLTLHHLGDHAGPRPDIVRAASEAAATLRVAPFALQLDRVFSFKSRPGRAPLVLAAAERSDAVAALKAFNLVLGEALMRARLGRWLKSDFKPHVTFLRSAVQAPVQPVAPIGWTVGEFMLVHSLIGQRQYTVLGRWPLRAR